MKPKVFTVSKINKYIKGMFDEDVLLQDLFVEAEISNFTYHASGHMYFTLKDDKAALSAVMFKGYAQGLAFLPENGMKVIVYGSISLYEKTGQYQLYVELLEPAGVGALHVAFEQLKEKLAKEGLFDQAHKKAIPAYPRCVAIVTSPTGAAVQDIIQIAKRRNKSVSLVVVPTKVQGEGAAKSVAHAIKLVNKWGKADVIIVGRGGGSIEDLWAFNEEVVARAIYHSKTPVISAVGHETDFTIADFAADLRAPTPSAAAELAVFREEAFVERLTRANAALHKHIERLFENRLYIEQCVKQMHKAMNNKIAVNKTALANKVSLLHQLSPLTVLKRGFALVYDETESMIKSVGQIKQNQKLRIQFHDGTVTGSVLSIKGDEHGK